MKTRMELKEEYKQLKYRMGVFQIRNTINGKVFIGGSTDLKAIWFSQKLQLDVGMHQNSGLQKDWKEFGSGSFVFEILDEIGQKEDDQINYSREVKALAELLIEELEPFDNKGYHARKIY